MKRVSAVLICSTLKDLKTKNRFQKFFILLDLMLIFKWKGLSPLCLYYLKSSGNRKPAFKIFTIFCFYVSFIMFCLFSFLTPVLTALKIINNLEHFSSFSLFKLNIFLFIHQSSKSTLTKNVLCVFCFVKFLFTIFFY